MKSLVRIAISRARREWFLSILLMLYVVLLLRDHSLLGRSPKLVDYGSLAAIVSLLAASRGFELSGIFNRIAPAVIELSGGSELRLLTLVLLAVALSSAVIMNDTAMFIFIPLVVTLSKISGVSEAKFVTLTVIAANVGSALTPIGNPQNVIIWRYFDIPFHTFVLNMAPFVLGWTCLLLTFVFLTSGGKFAKSFAVPRIRVNGALVTASAVLLVADIIFIQSGLALVGLVVTLVTLTIVKRGAVLSLDVALVLVFALIFVDFRELSSILPSTDFALHQKSPLSIVLISSVLSQAISNVPTTVLFAPTVDKARWLSLAAGVNLGGTGLVVGSLANFIAVRLAGTKLKDFHKYSLPYFVVALGLTLLITWL